jgi:Leucine-rich repeat (LRR) protein
MYKDTFSDAKNISFFRVLSYNLLSGKGFEDGTFKNLRNLYYLFWYSYFRTGSGATVNLPDIASCSNLQYFIMAVNNFSGSVPSFVSNNSIYYVDLAYNQLSGPVPQFTNKFNFAYLFLHNNQLSSFTGFNNTTNLIFVYLQNNVITGAIPFLSSNAPSLTRLYLFNNQFSTYEVGSFEQLTRIQVIDVSNNGLAQTDLNSIIDDLYKNYQLAPRRGVSINLRGQSRAPGYNPSSLGSEREQEIREKIDFLVASGWTINIGG